MKTLDILEIRATFNEIGKQVFETYASIIAEKKEISFLDKGYTLEETLQDCLHMDLPYFEFTNRNGDIVGARLVSITLTDGLYYVEDQDSSKSGFIGFFDINGLIDRVDILQSIQNHI